MESLELHLCNNQQKKLCISLLTSLKFLYGTNWTMSLATASPTVDLRTPSSPSRSSIALKSAGPTPTMMIDIGSRDARTMASRVWSKSVISPSVRIRRTKYCCRKASIAFTESLFIKTFFQFLTLCFFSLTEALLLCVLVEAMEAMWLIIGEKFVGPENFSWGKTIL